MPWAWVKWATLEQEWDDWENWGHAASEIALWTKQENSFKTKTQIIWPSKITPPESCINAQIRPFLNTLFSHSSYLLEGFYSDYSRQPAAWIDWALWTLQWWPGKGFPLYRRWGRWPWSLETGVVLVGGRVGCSHCSTSAREEINVGQSRI